MTRIELHSASEADYQKLHGAMEKLGFSRTITGSDKTIYKLPQAEYYLDRDGVAIADVLTWAQMAAGSTGRKFAALVSEAPVSTWTGLEPVLKAASLVFK